MDIFAFGDSYAQADAVSQAVDDYLVSLYNYDYNFTDAGVDYSTRIQYLETESGGIDGLDDDTNLPFMFRSYIVAYAEGA